jgi:hypothetical protein
MVRKSQGRRSKGHPVRLQLILVQKASKPLFCVELHNGGDQPPILNLGMMLGNGRGQYANRIHILLGGSREKLLHLEMRGPGVIAGRLDRMLVPIPVGATFALSIDLRDYSAPKEQIWNLNLPPGQYTLRAEYTGSGVPLGAANLDMQGIVLMPYWTGTVESNIVPFSLDQEKGNPRRHWVLVKWP